MADRIWQTPLTVPAQTGQRPWLFPLPVLIVFIVLIVLIVGAAHLGNPLPVQGASQRRQPVVPIESTVQLPQPIRLGRSPQGYSVRLDVVQLSGSGMFQYYLKLEARVSRERAQQLFMKRVRIDAVGPPGQPSDDGASFELRILPQHRGREGDVMRRLFHGQAEGRQLAATLEERSFPITVAQLRKIGAASELTLRIYGSTGRESEHTPKPKQLAALQSWIQAHVH